MLLPLKLICKENKTRRDGTSVVFIQYCYSSDKRILLNTGIAIPPVNWQKRRERITKDLPECYGNFEDLNKQLQNMLRTTEDIISYAVKEKIMDVLSFVKETFSPGFQIASLEKRGNTVKKTQPETNLDFFFQIDHYIQTKKNKVSAGSIGIIYQMKAILQAFEKHRGETITFQSLDYNFYESLVDFLTYEYKHRRKKKVTKGLKQNAIGRNVKQLRIFLRDRIRRKLIAPIDFSDFVVQEEDADAIYLNRQEINDIYQLDLSASPRLTASRDLFVLGCLTGLRFSDFSTIQPEDIRNGMLYKKQEKSDHWVVIPLRPVATEILINRFNKKIPFVYNADFNKDIKEIGRLAGIDGTIKFSYKKGNQDIEVIKAKYGWITSHTCRRSFCTNEYLAGTPVELIMKISGHKTLRSFYRYIKVTPEEAGQKIKQLWENRENSLIIGAVEKGIMT